MKLLFVSHIHKSQTAAGLLFFPLQLVTQAYAANQITMADFHTVSKSL